MASAALASSSVGPGRGSPDASYAAPPTEACSISNSRPSLLSAASTLTASAMTSGPTPSPGRTAIFMKRRRLTEQPGLFGAAPFFEGADLVRVAQSESYVVETVDQGVFAERVDVEAHQLAAVRGRDRLFLEVDNEPERGKSGDLMEQPVHFAFRERDRQQAVLAAVVEEYVGVGRREERAKTVLGKRPGRVLPRASAAEVLARKQYAGALVARLVEDEIGVERAARTGLVRLAFAEVAPGIEEIRPEPRALDRLQELLRDDLVGVDIGAVKRCHEAGQDGKALHQVISTGERRRSARRSPPPQPSPGSRGESCRPCPGGPRNCGSKSKRTVRPARAGPRSCPGTWNSRVPYTRTRRT